MTHLQLVFIAVLFILSDSALAADAFDSVSCGKDIPIALLGKQIGPEKRPLIEKKYEGIQLKHLGDTGKAKDSFKLSTWSICGEHYVLMSKNGAKKVITDIISIPTQLKNNSVLTPGRECKIKNEKFIGDLFAIVQADAKGPRVAIMKAWKIDKLALKFEVMSAADLTCESK